MRDGNSVTINRIVGRFDTKPFDFMANQLMPKQIEVDPLRVLPAPLAPQDLLIELSCHLKVVNRYRKMKWRELHG
jgi:hypothetical protein